MFPANAKDGECDVSLDQVGKNEAKDGLVIAPNTIAAPSYLSLWIPEVQQTTLKEGASQNQYALLPLKCIFPSIRPLAKHSERPRRKEW